LAAFHAGDEDAFFTLVRDDGFQSTVPAGTFFGTNFSDLERKALDLCHGRVLDVGAGAGRHSLALANRGLEVWSLDLLPELQKIMAERGVPRPIVGDIFTWEGGPFDTVLMLMNGIGMVGTPERLNDFLSHARKLVRPGGQILCDSIDVSLTDDATHAAYRNKNLARGLWPGQQRYTMRYEGAENKSFDWLHLDFTSLATQGRAAGWNCQLLEQKPDGPYLAKLNLA
jgi:SAM-dependent methyltransferase